MSKKDSKKGKITWKKVMKTQCPFQNKTVKSRTGSKIKSLPKISLEEAITWPSQTKDVSQHKPLEFIIHSGEGKNKYNELLDIHGKRLQEMDKNNVRIQVISPTAPGMQGLNKDINPVKKAQEINNYMFHQASKNPDRFKVFATLPMSNPYASSRELVRCVQEMNMVGALVNGNDTDKNGVSLFYDTPEYDVLWSTFVKLDVPLYIHPRVYLTPEGKKDKHVSQFYKKYELLGESAWGFSMHEAEHVLRLVMSGVFDRFPRLKVILGHMGEFLPWWAERFDHRICMYKKEWNMLTSEQKKLAKTNVLPERPLMEYLRRNIYVTTSGWFSDDALKYVVKKIGIDRVLFSIDYPYEEQKSACEWMDRIPFSFKDKMKIAYKNAAHLLKIKTTSDKQRDKQRDKR
jgi:2,3-dihydroxybenzoate decarboxylase